MATDGPVSEDAVRLALATVIEPEVGRPIGDLGMVRAVLVRPGRIQVSVALLVAGHPEAERIRGDVIAAVSALAGGEVAVEVDLTAMNDHDRARLRRQLQGERPDPAAVFTLTRVLAVASGKGGVGKSSIATNLAVDMARRGRRVALLDADVWGFSIPRMLGVVRSPLMLNGLLVPLRAFGVRVVSVGFLTEESAPVIWRGPMLHKMLEQFVTDVFWDDPEVLIVDMPPGTGDIALSVARLIPDTEVVVVTTPQPAAQQVAQRAAYAAREVRLRVSGVIENMSWFTADDGVRYEIFGAGGGELLAGELGVPLLGQVPLVAALREGADRGNPVVAHSPDSAVARSISTIAGRLLEMPPARVHRPKLTIRDG
ncbi:MAG: P-loop NTPase [Acidimicrobiales bacterium]